MKTLSFRDKQLPLNRELRSSLSFIYGVGKSKANFVCTKLGFAYPFNSNNLNTYEFGLINGLLNNILIGDVKAKRLKQINIKILKELKTLKGRLHTLGQPVRGQRTRTNARSHKRITGHLKKIDPKRLKKNLGSKQRKPNVYQYKNKFKKKSFKKK